MSKSELRSMFAKVVCVGARSGIIVALYLVVFLGALGLAAVLPEPWSAVGIAALVLVAGLALRGKWPGREFRLESVGLGYQPDRKPNPQPAAPASPRGTGGQTGRFLPCAPPSTAWGGPAELPRPATLPPTLNRPVIHAIITHDLPLIRPFLGVPTRSRPSLSPEQP